MNIKIASPTSRDTPFGLFRVKENAQDRFAKLAIITIIVATIIISIATEILTGSIPYLGIRLLSVIGFTIALLILHTDHKTQAFFTVILTILIVGSYFLFVLPSSLLMYIGFSFAILLSGVLLPIKYTHITGLITILVSASSLLFASSRNDESIIAIGALITVWAVTFYNSKGIQDALDKMDAANGQLAESNHALSVSLKEQELLIEKLEHASQSKTNFLHRMSHELRTPLSSIMGYTGFIIDDIAPFIPDEEEAQSIWEQVQIDLHAIKQSGRHLLDLIDDILDMARIEAGKMEVYPEPTDPLKDIIEPVMQKGFALARQKSITLDVHCENNLPGLNVDPKQCQRVLLNLVSNAIKYTDDKGSVKVIVETTSMGQISFSVQDTGSGIKEEDLPKLFELFERIDNLATRKAGGTGLGLPIAREIARMHNGDIFVESEWGTGSTFTFVIPLTVSHEMTRTASIADAGTTAKKIVIAVDNDITTLRIFERYLSNEYDLMTISDSQNATQQIEDILAKHKSNILAIIVDLLMPKSGREIIQEIRAAHHDIPIVICSLIDRDKDNTRLMAAYDVKAWLSKPIEETQLKATLRTISLKNILVVDDDENTRRMLSRIIQKSSIANARFARDGHHGLALVAEAMPDLIILDLCMPNMDGFEFLSVLRSDQSTKNLPVIVFTSKELSAREKEELETAVLTKGCSPEMIIDQIVSHFEQEGMPTV